MLNRILIILAIIAATVVYSVYQNHNLKSELAPEGTMEAVLTSMPDVQFETLEGQAYNIRDQKGMLTVIHYWGTWCAPCEAELPELLAFIKRFEAQPTVKFYLVAVNDDVIKVKKHIQKLNVPQSSVVWLMDNKNYHRDLFGTTRVPETFVFSSDNTTLRKYVGPQEWNKALFFQTFDEYLLISTRKL